MHTTRVLGIGKVFTTALLSLQAKNMLTPGQPVAVKSFFLKCTNPPSRANTGAVSKKPFDVSFAVVCCGRPERCDILDIFGIACRSPKVQCSANGTPGLQREWFATSRTVV